MHTAVTVVASPTGYLRVGPPPSTRSSMKWRRLLRDYATERNRRRTRRHSSSAEQLRARRCEAAPLQRHLHRGGRRSKHAYGVIIM